MMLILLEAYEAGCKADRVHELFQSLLGVFKTYNIKAKRGD